MNLLQFAPQMYRIVPISPNGAAQSRIIFHSARVKEFLSSGATSVQQLPLCWKRVGHPWFREPEATLQTEGSALFLAYFMREHARKRKTCRKLNEPGAAVSRIAIRFLQNFARESRAFSGIISGTPATRPRMRPFSFSPSAFFLFFFFRDSNHCNFSPKTTFMHRLLAAVGLGYDIA